MLYSLLLPNKHERGAEEMHNQNSSLCLQLFEYANTEPSNTYIQAKRKKKKELMEYQSLWHTYQRYCTYPKICKHSKAQNI